MTKATEKPLLEIQHLQMELPTEQGKLRAVDDVSFTLYPGKAFALVGESGCGKSLTALSILQLLPMNARCGKKSKIIFNDQDLLTLTENEMQRVRGKKIGMIFQEPMTALNPVLTIGYQIAETLWRHLQMPHSQIRSHSLQLLEQVGLEKPEQYLRRYPHEISGGQRQRVAIAIALAAEPDLLIADEPTTALDVTIQAQILNLLASLQKKRKMGLLLITHDLSVVARLADDVGVMYAGQLMEKAPVKQFFSHPAHPYSQALFAAMPQREQRHQSLFSLPGRVPELTQKFLGCRFVDRCPAAQEACKKHTIPWVDISDSQSIRCDIPEKERSWHYHPGKRLKEYAETSKEEDKNKTPILVLDDIHVNFKRKNHWWEWHGTLAAVDGVSLSLYPGKTLALVGESGSGKTTLAKALLRLVQMSGGKALLNEEGREYSIKELSAREQAKWLQIIFQDPYSSLDPRQTIRSILSEGLEVQGKQAISDPTIIELLSRVGLPPTSINRYPHQFSGGQRQRIAIARALAAKPKILICDEPTSALDVSVQAQVLNLLRELQADMQLAYLLITHNMSVVEYLADTVAVMYMGRIVEFGPVEQVLQKPRHPYTKLLLKSVLPQKPQQRKGVKNEERTD